MWGGRALGAVGAQRQDLGFMATDPPLDDISLEIKRGSLIGEIVQDKAGGATKRWQVIRAETLPSIEVCDSNGQA
jgi:hypothetical protein